MDAGFCRCLGSVILGGSGVFIRLFSEGSLPGRKACIITTRGKEVAVGIEKESLGFVHTLIDDA